MNRKDVMSQWTPNYTEPFYEGRSQYEGSSYNGLCNTPSPYVDHTEFHNYGSQFPQSINMPIVDSSVPGSSSTPSAPHNNFLTGSGELAGGTSSQAQLLTVLNSNLTPLAKEFKPMNYVPLESDNDINRKRGAIKKNGTKSTYWNKNNKREHRNFNSERNENHSYRQTNGAVAKKKEFQKSNVHNDYLKDFNKSSEQSKILEETKKFLRQVNAMKGNEDRDEKVQQKTDRNVKSGDGNQNDFVITENPKSDVTFNTRYNRNNYYGRNSYNNRGKNYKQSYRQDYSLPTENKIKEFQGTPKGYESNRNNQDIEKRNTVENERKSFNEFSYENKVSKINLRKKLDAASQRERLEQLITCRLLECLVCCEKLRHADPIWSCKQCFHILHLQCIKRWAQSSKLDAGWRCPACQNVYQDIPTTYRCYCNKQSNPNLEPGEIPHSCGDPCGRKGRSCSHGCTLICHPGPCPDCDIMVARSCGCGTTRQTVKCTSKVAITCQNICNKVLNCGLHECKKTCHEGDCNPCDKDLKQECYCGKVGRKIKCSVETNQLTTYECGEMCGKVLSCGNHKCTQNCHAGPCNLCAWDPSQITACPCGQTKLAQKRNSCTDPIPCCKEVCNKILLCGQPSAPHHCVATCHEGPCPPCTRTTIMRCRCGHMDKEIPCTKVTTRADDARCEKKCIKKRLCGKHKCNLLCCIEMDHICPLLCNRLLSCGQHRCEERCHKGRCSPCWRTSFEELYCECGSSVLYPPVACGTRPPPCDQPCSRIRPCGHDSLHNCHTGPCPPCTVLTKRWCHGQHEQRSAIPCYQENFSCGLPCGRDLPCGKHKCIQPCHDDLCRIPCSQPCSEVRSVCGHPCNLPCHNPPCLETSCKYLVKVTCQCGLRKSNRVCMELAGEYQNIAMSQLASKMEEMQLGHSVDITDIVNGQRKSSLKTLDCNDECKLVERNRRLAIGLQIRNPDLSAKLMPRYSDYMRSWAKKDPKFAQSIHDKLTELVQLAKQSKQKSRSYSFETMNREKRHFVHEYCEHFGCESAAYDPEPNRNVVATAFKDKSWLPSYSLLAILQRESGQRKVPGPQQLGKGVATKSEAVSLKLPGRTPRPPTPPGEYVDYFNNPPE